MNNILSNNYFGIFLVQRKDQVTLQRQYKNKKAADIKQNKIMINNEGKQKYITAQQNDQENELKEDEVNRIKLRSNMNKILLTAVSLISFCGGIRHLLLKQTALFIIIDALHLLFQLIIYYFCKKYQHSSRIQNILIFMNSIIFIFYIVSVFQFEKQLKSSICSSKNTDIDSNSSRSSTIEDSLQDDSYLNVLKLCDGNISWYNIQGEMIFIYLNAQGNMKFSIIMILCHLISGISSYQKQFFTHAFLFIICVCYLFQKKSILAFSSKNQVNFEQTYQKYQFWLQFVYRYLQNDIFLVQLQQGSPQSTAAESNNEMIEHLDGNSEKIDEKIRNIKKPSISYKCSPFNENNSLIFPFINLSAKQKQSSQDDSTKSLTCSLNNFIFRKFRKRDSPTLQPPQKSLQCSLVQPKSQRNILQNTNENNNNNQNNNQISKLNLNQNQQTCQYTSNLHTLQHEDTIQLDTIRNQYSSFHQINPINPKINSNLQLGSIYNPKTKRNTILTHFNHGNTDRKNSKTYHDSDSPPRQFESAIKSQYENILIKSPQFEDIQNKQTDIQKEIDLNIENCKKDHNLYSPISAIDGETLLSTLKRNLIEQKMSRGSNQIDKFQQKLQKKYSINQLNYTHNNNNNDLNQINNNNNHVNYNNNKPQVNYNNSQHNYKNNNQVNNNQNKSKTNNNHNRKSKNKVKESKLGEQNIYIFEKAQQNNEVYSDILSQQLEHSVSFIDCMYSGRQSLLVIIERQKRSQEISKQISNPQKQSKSDMMKIKTFKQKIISSLAHELKTPLNSIISFVNQILPNKNEEQVTLKQNDILILKSNASLLNYKIEDLLNYSLFLQGERKMNIEKFSIQEIMNEMIEIFKPQAKLKQLYFHSKISLLQPSMKKSLELKQNTFQINQINMDYNQAMKQNISNSNNLKSNHYQPSHVSNFKRKLVSIKFMSEKIINPPIQEVYSNGSIPSSQNQQTTQKQTDYQQSPTGQLMSSNLNQPDVFVRSDKKKLICILINLLTNALKFTFKGGVSFTVNQIDKYNFEFTVTDTGIGIGERLVKKLNNTNLENYDNIFLNNDDDSFDDQQGTENELEDNTSHQKQNKQKKNHIDIVKQLESIKGIEIEKRSEGVEVEINHSLKSGQSNKLNNMKRMIEIKDLCSMNSSYLSQEDENANSELQSEKNNKQFNQYKEESDKCSISLMAAQENQRKGNLSIFSQVNYNHNNDFNNKFHNTNLNIQNNIQQKPTNLCKSQPSLYNFQRNCGIGIKLVKILSSQIYQNQSNLRIKSKENQGSSFSFTLQDLQQNKMTTLSQFIISDKQLGSLKKINIPSQNLDFLLSKPRQDEIILSDDSVESKNDIQSQSIHQQIVNTNLTNTSIAEFIENNNDDSSKNKKNENIRKSICKKFKSDLDFLANQNLLNSNSLKLQALLSDKKILIVDDMPFNIEILKNYLKGLENLEIKEAFNGMSAVEMVQNEQFDLILMDINMPVMDGIEATLKITDLVKQKLISPVPVIIVTAYTGCSDVQNSLQSGAAYHVSKPIQITNLIKAIEVAFGTS